ncbi:unnamed protein product [Rhizoctonia solani]|uniref:Peptidase S8/S53 domain-containing protein n=1 Tax=Rhizoctonia solani TaxID=456999 RepID=A0A8H3HXF6_9AGAM|nr:unnamed protein product [Rhizoctonia solani]
MLTLAKAICRPSALGHRRELCRAMVSRSSRSALSFGMIKTPSVVTIAKAPQNGIADTYTVGTRPEVEVSSHTDERQTNGHAILAAAATPVGINNQSDAPWGLERLSRIHQLPKGSNPLELNHNYRYQDSARVADVDVYVLDSGIMLNHEQFGGRARFGRNFTKEVDHDIDGHADQGVHVVAAAGNDNSDARHTSPARAANVLAVGASTVRDECWVEPNRLHCGSSFGACVRVFAPGVNVMSAGIRSTTHLVPKTGTSMAAPHVAGLIAYFIRKDGNRTPAEMIAYIQNSAHMNVLGKVPKGTANRLAYNNVV